MLRIVVIGLVPCLFAMNAYAGLVPHYHYADRTQAVPTVSRTDVPCTSAAEYTTSVALEEPVTIRRIVADGSGSTVVAGGNFVAKVDAGGCVVFTVSLGGFDGRAVAVGSDGSLHIAGNGIAGDGTVGNGLYVRLAADGSRLLGSVAVDGWVNGIALDAESNVYFTGATISDSFPDDLRASTYRAGPYIGAAFFLKLEGRTLARVASGYLAGNRYDCGVGSSCFVNIRMSSGVAIAVDGDRNIVFAGNSEVRDLPTTERALLSGGIGGFVAKSVAMAGGCCTPPISLRATIP